MNMFRGEMDDGYADVYADCGDNGTHSGYHSQGMSTELGCVLAGQ